jgi:hypothetical protein
MKRPTGQWVFGVTLFYLLVGLALYGRQYLLSEEHTPV